MSDKKMTHQIGEPEIDSANRGVIINKRFAGNSNNVANFSIDRDGSALVINLTIDGSINNNLAFKISGKCSNDRTINIADCVFLNVHVSDDSAV